MKSKNIIILIIIAFGLIAGGYFLFFKPTPVEQSSSTEKQLYSCGMHPEIISDEPGNCPICEMKLTPIKNGNKEERKILFYRSPMDPNIISDYSRKDEMGMDYIPVYSDETASEGVISIDPVVVQNMNVKTEPVMSKRLSNVIVTNGILTTNEIEDYIVTTRVNGWVNKLYINYIGQKVKSGDKLMEIYSPELVTAQQELLTALSYQTTTGNTDIKDILKSGDQLVKNSVRKLQLLEMSETDIQLLQSQKEVKTYITLYAPKSGTVISKNILEGQKVMPGMPLIQFSNLNSLWLTADIYEYELSKVITGAQAEIRFNFLPGKIFNGKVDFIYPTLDAKTRTAKIRININNSNNLFKPSMLASVTIKGRDLGKTLVVPENAVIRSGRKDIVIISLGEGKFKPQNVTLGDYSEGYYQVLEGLSEGIKIVTSAQFLIDSESNLKAAVSQFTESRANFNPKDTAENNKISISTKETKTDEILDHSKHESKKGISDSKNIVEPQSIVRQGLIDLIALDINKDGKVFQDPMDWNVISDEAGRCPLCEMKLKEVTLDEAKKNLLENGFKAK